MEDSGNETDRGSSTNNTLTETSGTIPQSADKKVGTYSRDFERGGTEYLGHADNLDTNLFGVNQKMAIVCWFKRESGTTVIQAIVSKNKTQNNNRQYTFNQNEQEHGQLTLCPDGITGTIGVGLTKIANAVWGHQAASYNDTDIRVYVNNSLDSNGANNPKSYTGGMFEGDSTFAIGAYFGSAGAAYRHWDGLLDDVGILKRDLSTVEITEIYTYGFDGSIVLSSRRIIMMTQASVTSTLSRYLRSKLGIDYKPVIVRTGEHTQVAVLEDGSIKALN